MDGHDRRVSDEQILVIDDDDNIQKLLQQLLRPPKYEEALDYLTDHAPDLIFLDVDSEVDGCTL